MTRSVQIEAIGLANPPRRFGQHGAFQMAGYTSPRIGCAGALPTLDCLRFCPRLSWTGGNSLLRFAKLVWGESKHMNSFRVVFLSLAFAFSAELAAPAQDNASDAVEIKITAKKYEFSPDTVRVKQGDHVTLVITALDREHGIKISAFQINQKLPKGEAVTVDFIADRSGTFPFQCSDFCGLGHGKMKGELIVE